MTDREKDSQLEEMQHLGSKAYEKKRERESIKAILLVSAIAALLIYGLKWALR